MVGLGKRQDYEPSSKKTRRGRVAQTALFGVMLLWGVFSFRGEAIANFIIYLPPSFKKRLLNYLAWDYVACRPIILRGLDKSESSGANAAWIREFTEGLDIEDSRASVFLAIQRNIYFSDGEWPTANYLCQLSFSDFQFFAREVAHPHSEDPWFRGRIDDPVRFWPIYERKIALLAIERRLSIGKTVDGSDWGGFHYGSLTRVSVNEYVLFVRKFLRAPSAFEECAVAELARISTYVHHSDSVDDLKLLNEVLEEFQALLEKLRHSKVESDVRLNNIQKLYDELLLVKKRCL